MKYTVYDRLLKREIGYERKRYSDIRGIYGDRQWIDRMDIVNELEGHNGCVNALWYVCLSRDSLLMLTSLTAGPLLAVCLPLAPTTTASTSTAITPRVQPPNSTSPHPS